MDIKRTAFVFLIFVLFFVAFFSYLHQFPIVSLLAALVPGHNLKGDNGGG